MLTTFSGRKPSQNAHELGAFVNFLRAQGVQRYGEIGARDGDTFHHILTALPECRGVAMDLPGGLWGHENTRQRLERAVADLGTRASCLFGDSKTLATVRMFQGRGPYDAILIDGDHTLEGVTADWGNYRKMARIVAFHDIVGVGQREKKPGGRPVEVPTFWRVLKSQGYNTVEFVAPGSKMGIGCVLLDTEATP